MKQTQRAPLWFLFAILLASVSATPAFNLYFIPAEVMADASLQRVGPQGSIANNYLDFFSESGVAYLQKPIYVAGQVTQDSVPTVSVSLATTTITFVDTSVSPLLAYASLFPDVPPTSESSFSILAQDLNVLKANPFNNATSLLINVPDYSSTLERTLVFDLPYKLNAAFFVVRVTPMTQAFVQMNFDSDDFCFARVALGGPVKYTNYAPSRLSGTSRAIFEWSIPFGQSITDVTVGFPEDTYNVTLSNWADIASFPFPNVRPFAAGTAPSSLTAFSWPPSSLISSLFTYLPSSLQFGRNPAAKLFHVQDYVLIAYV